MLTLILLFVPTVIEFPVTPLLEFPIHGNPTFHPPIFEPHIHHRHMLDHECTAMRNEIHEKNHDYSSRCESNDRDFGPMKD